MSGIERIDCHVHTWYSGHGEGTVAEVVSAAEERGIGTLALTEHLTLPSDLDPTGRVSMTAEQVPSYLADIERERDLHPQMEIICGTEVDWLGAPDPVMLEEAKGYEYVLGSVHYLDGWAYDDPTLIDQWEKVDVDAVWRRYAEVWCEAALSPYPFTCMSHPDLPKKFGFRPSFDTHEMFGQMAAAAAEGGRMVEVNTAGLRKPVHEIYPSHDLLAAFCDAGVECTFGSDAHAPSLVGFGYAEACAELLRVGYTYITVPTRDGGRRRIALEG
jgi:histidinol-phosphatase (PHP family)